MILRVVLKYYYHAKSSHKLCGSGVTILSSLNLVPVATLVLLWQIWLEPITHGEFS